MKNYEDIIHNNINIVKLSVKSRKKGQMSILLQKTLSSTLENNILKKKQFINNIIELFILVISILSVLHNTTINMEILNKSETIDNLFNNNQYLQKEHIKLKKIIDTVLKNDYKIEEFLIYEIEEYIENCKSQKDYNISKVYLDNELEKIINIYLRTNKESYGIETYHYQNIMAYSIIEQFIKIKKNTRECQLK
jgi:hypothetical protein